MSSENGTMLLDYKSECEVTKHSLSKYSMRFTVLKSRVVKNILSSRRIREGSWRVFPGGTGRERHITIDINSSIQVSSSCQT